MRFCLEGFFSEMSLEHRFMEYRMFDTKPIKTSRAHDSALAFSMPVLQLLSQLFFTPFIRRATASHGVKPRPLTGREQTRGRRVASSPTAFGAGKAWHGASTYRP